MNAGMRGLLLECIVSCAQNVQAVAKRVGGLDSHHDDWAATLSLGEQQRLALARLLLHNPDIAFLDEATSGLGISFVRSLVAAFVLNWDFCFTQQIYRPRDRYTLRCDPRQTIADWQDQMCP
eukprot:SAG31_NODE_40_length_31360_cov_6.751575_13_plen_122_part_00